MIRERFYSFSKITIEIKVLSVTEGTGQPSRFFAVELFD
jgi:hypothetical protein